MAESQVLTTVLPQTHQNTAEHKYSIEGDLSETVFGPQSEKCTPIYCAPNVENGDSDEVEQRSSASPPEIEYYQTPFDNPAQLAKTEESNKIAPNNFQCDDTLISDPAYEQANGVIKKEFKHNNGTATKRTPNSGAKACAKKSFVWKYFRHPEITNGVVDRSRTQCILCDSQLAFNASGTTTTMLNHLKSRHGEIAEHEESSRRYNRLKGLNRMELSSAEQTLTEEEVLTQLPGLNDARSVGNGNQQLTKSPVTVGQRGRPPGSGRRPKPKNAGTMDYLNHPGLQNGPLKPENNMLFPVSHYLLFR